MAAKAAGRNQGSSFGERAVKSATLFELKTTITGTLVLPAINIVTLSSTALSAVLNMLKSF
jgi:hypothetical protein